MKPAKIKVTTRYSLFSPMLRYPPLLYTPSSHPTSRESIISTNKIIRQTLFAEPSWIPNKLQTFFFHTQRKTSQRRRFAKRHSAARSWIDSIKQEESFRNEQHIKVFLSLYLREKWWALYRKLSITFLPVSFATWIYHWRIYM